MGRQVSGGQADRQTGKWWIGRWADRQVADRQMGRQESGGHADGQTGKRWTGMDRQASGRWQMGRQASGKQADGQTGKW